MYINTTVNPVSFFFSQSGILVTGSNHKHRQDNHIPSGEDWAKKEGIMPATIYPSPTPPFLGGVTTVDTALYFYRVHPIHPWADFG